MTEKSKKKGNPHTDMGTPHIGMGRDMSIFQIGESPYRYGVHSNLGTNISSISGTSRTLAPYVAVRDLVQKIPIPIAKNPIR